MKDAFAARHSLVGSGLRRGIAILAILACSDSPTATVELPSGATTTVTASPLTLVAGDTSTVTVHAKTADGDAFIQPGIIVTLATDMGSVSAVTDHGDGSYSAMIASTSMGDAHVTGTISGTAISQSVTVKFIAGAPATVTKTAGDGQSATVSTAVPTVPTVIVKDKNGNAVAGATVTFAIASGDGSLTGGTQTTSPTGAAAVGSWTLGATPGANTLTATAGGVTATFTATGTSSAAGSISKTAGDGQTAIAGTAVAVNPKVLIVDGAGAPKAGVSVTFAVVTGGGTTTGATQTTDANGFATVGSWTLGATAGPNTLSATAGVLSTTFSASGTAGAAGTIAVSAGDNQTATVGTTVANPPAVLVADANGNPKSGVSVTFAVLAGNGSVTGATATTNASGIATIGSWTLGTTAGTNQLTATAGVLTLTFNAMGTAGAAGTMTKSAGDLQSAVIGAAVAVAPAVTVTDANGNPVSGIAVTFAVASGGGSVVGPTATTNASGVAAVGSWTLGTASGANTLTATAGTLSATFSAMATAGSPTAIEKNVGDGQSATVGNPVATASAVLVRDSHSNPVPGVTVTFAVASGGGSVTGATQTTDANGIATVGSWTLGAIAGANTMSASIVGGLSVTFSATGTAAAPGTPIKQPGGDLQTAVAGVAVAVAPAVKVADAGGNPVAGVAVTFAVASGGGSVTGATATTNASGIATVGSWTLGNTAGSNSLTATANSLTATFTATGIAGDATNITKVSASDGQTAVGGSAVAVAPAVTVTDVHSNPVSGVSVSFAASGNGSVTGSPATTNALGVATLGSWTLATTVGANTLTATAGLLNTSFSATSSAGPVDHLVVQTAAGGAIGSQVAGTSFAIKITAQDVNNNTATSFTGTANLTKVNSLFSSGTATTTAAFVGGVLASHTVTFTLAGTSVSITATNAAGAQTGTSASFNVVAGAATKLQVLLPGETAAAGSTTGKTGSATGQTAGTSFTVIVNAVDANWNVSSSATPTVTFTSTDGSAVLPTAAALVSGTRTYTNGVTLKTAPSATVTVSDQAAVLTSGVSAAVVVGPAALDHFAVEAVGGAAVTTQGSNQPFNIQITAKDIFNNTATSFTSTAAITASGATLSGGPTVTSGTFVAGVLSSQSLTFTTTGNPVSLTATALTKTGTSAVFSVLPPPAVTTPTPANLAVSVSRSATITIPFNQTISASGSAITIKCPSTGASLPFTSSPSLPGGGFSSVTLTPSSALPAGTSCQVTVSASQIGTSLGLHMTSDFVFSFETVPSTGTDVYPQTLLGNMSVQSANVGVPYSFTTNDQSAESFTITSFSATSANGGNVSVTTSGPNMGQFTYNPPAGYGRGQNDTFTYTITTSGGSTAIGTVTMPLNGMVWYIDANAGTNGDGRMSNPFNSLAAFNAINDGTGTHPAAGDIIFLYESSTAYVGPLTLLAHQRLIGQDAASSMQTLTTFTPPSSSVAFPATDNGVSNGTNVTITSPSNGITTATGDSLVGFRVGGNSGTGTVTGTAIGGTGNLYIRNVAITQGVTGAALVLSSGAADIVLDSTRVTGGTHNIVLSAMTGSINMGSGTVSSYGASSAASDSINGGSVSLTVNGPVAQSNVAPVLAVVDHTSGTVAFGGAVSASTGTGLQFNNADGTYNFTGVVTVNGTASQAIGINTGSSGTVNISNASSVITNPSSDALVVSGSNPTFTYAGSISKNTAGRALLMSTVSGGTTTLSGSLNCTSSCSGISIASNTGGTINFSNASKTINTTAAVTSAVSLTSNTGSTINFTNGGLAISTTTANGFLSSGGGTINVSGAGNTITTTSGGTGLNVQNPTSGGALTFQSISTSSAANGIVMVGTGTGGLTVTGNTGTPGRCDAGLTTCTGGTITGATGADGAVAGNGIYLSNAPNVSLTRMRVAGTAQNFGLYGNTVSGLSLNTMLFNGTFGTAVTEAALGFDEMTGSASITNSSIMPATGSWGDGLRITNTTGTALNRLTMNADTVGFTGTNGTNGVNILARGINTTNVTVQNSTFRGGKSKTFLFSDSVSATSNLVFTNNLVQQGTGAYGAGALAALNIRMTGATTLTDSIAFNTFTNLTNPNNAAFEFNPGLPGFGLSGSADGYIGHNAFGTSGSANSGSVHNSINIDFRGSGTSRVKVADNSMYQYGDHPFRANAYDDGATAIAGNHNGRMDLTFVRNTIQEPRAGATFVAGVQLDVGRSSGGAMTMCVNFGVGGLNNMNNSGSTDADTPFDIVSNTTSNGSFLKYLNYSGSDTGASGLAEGKLNTLFRAGIASSTFDGFLDVSQAALITSATNNASGAVCNLPPAT